MNDYEKCKTIRRMIMTRAGEIMIYNWGDSFCKKQIHGFPNELKTRIKGGKDLFDIQISQLTKDQMDDLGFGKWSVDDDKMLIPIWLYPFLPEKIKTRSISDSGTIKKSPMDTDHRMGYLAYGVYPIDCKFENVKPYPIKK